MSRYVVFSLCVLSTLVVQGIYSAPCANLWDEGCVNGELIGSGGDDNYLNGGFNPGKRCANVWDEGCINGQLPGSGKDDDYLNGNFNPGKRFIPGTRCANVWDEGCINGQLPGSGKDDDYLNGNFNPGKRNFHRSNLAKLDLIRALQLNHKLNSNKMQKA